MSKDHKPANQTTVTMFPPHPQPVCTVAVQPQNNPLITNSSIPPSSLLSSSQNLWLSDVGAFQKPLPNIERTLGPRILGSFPGYRGSGAKQSRILRHATFSDSFLHSRKNGLLGEIKTRSSTVSDLRHSTSAAESNSSTNGSNPVPHQRIRFHSVDGNHFMSIKPSAKLQNIMRIQNQESKFNKNKFKTTHGDFSTKSYDKNNAKTNETFEALKERAKRLKRIIEEDKKNNNLNANQKQENGQHSLGHKNYCDERKTNQVVEWLAEVNKEIYSDIADTT